MSRATKNERLSTKKSNARLLRKSIANGCDNNHANRANHGNAAMHDAKTKCNPYECTRTSENNRTRSKINKLRKRINKRTQAHKQPYASESTAHTQ